MASAVRNRHCPWLETRIVPCRVPSLIGEDCSIGGAICVRVGVSSVAYVVF